MVTFRTKLNFHLDSPMFFMCVGILMSSLCFCCPPSCECPAQDNSTFCRHRLLNLVPPEIPLSSHVLDLSYNRIRSVQPKLFSHLHSLEELDLSHNQLSRMEPGVFSGLLKLRILLVHHNQLKLLPPGVFSGIPDLTWLDVRGNQLVILLDQTFQGLRELRHLEAGDNPLLFISPGAFLGLPQLQRLGLEETKLGSVPTRALSALPRLSDLRLGGVTSPFLQDLSFSGLPLLRVLDMDHWPSLGTVKPLSLSGLNLTSLSITRCNLSSVPEALSMQVYLRRLDLSRNPISDLKFGGLRALRRLEELRLSGGKLNSIPSGSFSGLDNLLILDLSENPLKWIAEDALPSSSAILETMLLSGTNLSCDCRLCWLLRYNFHFGESPPVCAAPDELHGMVIPDHSELLCPERFTCHPPRITESRPWKMTVQEGDQVTITCHSQGVPEPSIQWVLPHNPYSGGTESPKSGTSRSTPRLSHYHLSSKEPSETEWPVDKFEIQGIPNSGLPITTASPVMKRVTILPEGYLQFHPVQANDAGAYLCLASNVAGNDSAWVHLEVTAFNGSSAVQPSLLHSHLLAVITAGGVLPFISSVALCFIFMFLWSRGRGNIKHTANIDFVPRTSRGTSNTEENKFTMKLI
ncbi:leucine-rich repeat and immunoglobulin-like domain-containing nogo receptor-interacting protein 4 [Spea bombifrons]|uniref:leucine-rich repeat and immunoglobulin-like domain-containing nogo receptor-interacting protein 4 n=1 Tax=Spea bombifrons TaxID=233779 RepID=UPI00234BD4DA|nr:leucine-rich repeat and immunoglobulin-like domain-containing nogo receptor-interacting protein 4 [Spea bombifrons]